MRLVCPNCDAQYEVDDAAIPAGGRDVQCSNCGHAWFQMPADLMEDEDEDEDGALFGAPVGAVELPQAPPASQPAPKAVAMVAEPEAVPDLPQPRPAPVAAGDAADPPRATLDDTLMAVLREEAARETAARRAEAVRSVEVQPDLGLVQSPATRIAPAMPDSAEPLAAQRHGARRELLPDIEEINSTLRASGEARANQLEAIAPPEVAQPRASGFRVGFAAMLILAVILVAFYVMAPRIAQHLPGSAPAMERYVRGVDEMRVWLDVRLQGAVMLLRGLSGQDG